MAESEDSKQISTCRLSAHTAQTFKAPRKIMRTLQHQRNQKIKAVLRVSYAIMQGDFPKRISCKQCWLLSPRKYHLSTLPGGLWCHRGNEDGEGGPPEPVRAPQAHPRGDAALTELLFPCRAVKKVTQGKLGRTLVGRQTTVTKGLKNDHSSSRL